MNTMSDTETNGNKLGERRGPTLTSGSVEDLSEYTDADESISAPTEILAEFLSAIMLKDYEMALKYCKLILHYEPNNSTAREFYPLIAEKIELMKNEENETDDNSSEYSDTTPSESTRSTGSSDDSESSAEDLDATSASYSSLEDDEADKVKETETAILTSNDAANGNTLRKNELLNIVGDILTYNDELELDKANGNEEYKRKLENINDMNTVSPEISSFPQKKSTNDGLTTSIIHNLRRNVEGVTRDTRCLNKTSIPSSNLMKSKFNEFNENISNLNNSNHAVFSSESQYSTDLTKQETKRKTVKEFPRFRDMSLFCELSYPKKRKANTS